MTAAEAAGFARAVEPVPERVGRYLIRGELGRGMMGVVYDAFDPTLDRRVALKTIRLAFAISAREREAFEQRFFAEARAAAGLQHPGVVVIHDLGRDDDSGTLYMAQELLQGRNLEDIVAEEKPVEWREALRIGAALADALHAAHQRGIVHRDVKPGNVILLESGEPKVLDFGIAKLPASELTGAGQVFGTPAYMSPEQALGDELGPRSDVFSLGSVLYQMLTGRRAFMGESVARVLYRVAHDEPPVPSHLNPALPRPVDALLARALAKRPERRYQSARELAEDARDLVEDRPPRHLTGIAALPPTTPAAASAPGAAPPQPTLDLDEELQALASEPTHEVEEAARPRRARRRRYLAGALGVAALAALAFALARPSREATGPDPAPVSVREPAPTPVPVPVPMATLDVDLEHHLRSGHLRLWVDGEVALDRWLHADSEKSVIGIKFRHGELSESIRVEAGTHDIRVRLAWDDNIRSETVTAHFVPNETRTLRLRTDRLTKKLSVDWR